MLRVMRASVSLVYCAKLPGGFARYSVHDHIVMKERVTFAPTWSGSRIAKIGGTWKGAHVFEARAWGADDGTERSNS
jgi:hypothetical protein